MIKEERRLDMDNSFLENQLEHKQRSVADLARFIRTRAGKAANFTLLMGAGCSVSSDIRSAKELSEAWMRELFAGNAVGGKSLDEMREELQKNHGDWYNKDHEYSCLFEHRFDLPSQRRAFVEEEVGGKFPSLGYAYLIRLIDAGYFNTVFTTNFDDLLNEAFHVFAGRKIVDEDVGKDIMRPIVCAHDSSVRSISISSPRPKIIKLHGDYLFDDIKSTLRETESLEDNIRDKFVEFCKEFGLIVVGYSGNDRSVMDILNYLLKRDDYLKHGLYWCLRKTDNISDDLKKLLWKDKVYYVYIDGYDELCASLYKELVPNEELPVSIISLGLNNGVLQRLSDNKYLKNSPSQIIQRDLERIRDESRRSSLFNKVKDELFPGVGRDRARGLTWLQTTQLMEVDRCFDNKQYEKALSKISDCMEERANITYAFKMQLMRLKVIALDRLGRGDEARLECDKLIEMDMSQSFDLLSFKNRLFCDYQTRIKNIRTFLEQNKYDYRAYDQLTDYEWKLVSQNHDTAMIPQLLKDLDKGIACNPSKGNDCYSRKMDILLSQKGLAGGDWENDVERILSTLEAQDPQSPVVYGLKLQAYEIIKKPEERLGAREEIWKELKDRIEQGKQPFIKYVQVLNECLRADMPSYQEILSFIRTKIHESEWRYNESATFLHWAASFSLYKDRDVGTAIRYLKDMAEDSYEYEDVVILMDIMHLMKNDEVLKPLNGLLEKVEKEFSQIGQLKLRLHRLERSHDYKEALRVIEKLKDSAGYKYEYFTAEMHARLWCDDYDGVYNASHDVFKVDSNWTENHADIVNYQIAKIKRGGKVQKKSLDMILNGDADGEIKAAAYVLIEKYDEAARMLEKTLRWDLRRALNCNSYYIFQKMGDEKIRNVIRLACDVQPKG